MSSREWGVRPGQRRGRHANEHEEQACKGAREGCHDQPDRRVRHSPIDSNSRPVARCCAIVGRIFRCQLHRGQSALLSSSSTEGARTRAQPRSHLPISLRDSTTAPRSHGLLMWLPAPWPVRTWPRQTAEHKVEPTGTQPHGYSKLPYQRSECSHSSNSKLLSGRIIPDQERIAIPHAHIPIEPPSSLANQIDIA